MRAHERSLWWFKEKKQMAFVFIILTMMLQFQMKGCVGCLLGLLELKSYLMNVYNVEEESILKSWSNDDSNSECCAWEGVECSNVIGGHIVGLSYDQYMPSEDVDEDIRALNLSLLHSFPQLTTFKFSYGYFFHLFDPIYGFESFQRLKNLRNLDLSYNHLNNGVLPFISAARSLRNLTLEWNNLDGVFPPNGNKGYEGYQGDIIADLYGLDLSNNQLSGEIPIEIGNLRNIKSLNFSNNQLTGFIPDSISKLRDMESLDLSNNKLDGKIPPQLADLNNLGYFNVSYNNLSGAIPVNGHLLTFDENSYIGNAHLCGLPTKKICNPTTAPEQANEQEEENDDVINMVWFYWSCGAVYISTLLSLLAFLCIDSHWSREWFYRVELVIHHLQRLKACFLWN